jgi:phage baseplate assembly protein W
MPYVSQTLNPVKYSDRHTAKQSQFYKGFSTVNPNATDVKLYDYDLIKQDILNQFQVRKNERVMDPKFGTIIWDLLFDPLTDQTKRQIADDVTRIVTSDPRASALEINVVEQEYGLLLEITLQYIGSDQTQVLKLNFDKEIGLSVV